MNILPEIVSKLTKEETRNFKLFIKRTNADKDRKDEWLFDLIKKNFPDNYDEDSIFKKLYETDDKNAFYRLKNKLFDDIGLSLTFFHFNSRDVNIVLKDIFLTKIFFDKNLWNIARYFLSKAEKRAIAIENYELLDLIYSEFIKLSLEILDVNPQDYINKRLENKKKLDDLREIDNVLAVVIYKIRTSQTFSKNAELINQLLEESIEKLKNNKYKSNSQLKFKIYQAVSRILLSRQDFATLEKYLLKTYADFEKEKLFDKNNHDTKLQMLIYICNTLYKTEKYKLSLKHAEQLKKAMEEYDGILYAKYIFFYYNTLVNNYSEIDKNKAIETLNKALQINEIKSNPVHLTFVYGNLATSYFDLENYKLSISSILKLMHLAAYDNFDAAFRLSVEIIELILRYVTKDFDYLDTKQRKIMKEHKQLLGMPQHTKDVQFLSLLRSLSKNNGDVGTVKLQNEIRNFINAYKNKPPQTEVINYINWLKKLLKGNE